MARWLGGLILLLAVRVALAGEAGIAGVVSRLPDEVRGVVVIRDPMGLRARLVPSEPEAVFTRLGMLPGIDRRWQALARALELPSQQAMDDLLGGGVAVIATDVVVQQGQPQVRYAIVGLVSEATADRVREKLRAIPAMVVGGQPVYAIENGSLWMMLRPMPGLVGVRTHAVVVTASSSDVKGLGPLAEMLGRVPGEQAGGAGRLVGTAAWEGAFSDVPGVWGQGRPARGDVVVFWRAGVERSGWSVARVQVEGARWACSAFSTDGALFGRFGELAGERGVMVGMDGGLIERLPGGSVLVLHDCTGVVQMDAKEGVKYGVGGGKGGQAREMLVVVRRGAVAHLDVAVAERSGGLEEGAARLDRVAMGILSRVRQGEGQPGGPDGGVLKVLDFSTWRQVPLRLVPGMGLMPLVGPRPQMAWRGVVGARGEVWSLWAWSPGAEGRPGEDVGKALAGVGGGDGRLYLLRLRARPSEGMGGLPAAIALPFADVGVVHDVVLDVWREGGRARAECVVEWGRPGGEVEGK